MTKSTLVWMSWVGENRVLAGKAGAIDVVVATMRVHVDNVCVFEQACKALINMCYNGAICYLLGWKGRFSDVLC